MLEFEIGLTLTQKINDILETSANRNGRFLEEEIAIGIASGTYLMKELQKQREKGVKAKVSLVDKETGQVIKSFKI